MSQRIQTNLSRGVNFKTCVVSICSPEFEKWAKVQERSLERWGNGFDYFMVHTDELKAGHGYTPGDNVIDLVEANRPKVILKYLERYEQVIFVGADVWFVGPIKDVLKKYPTADGMAAVHCTTPHPEDGKSPNNWSNHLIGHLNADFQVWRNTEQSRKFLEWCASQMERYAPTTPHKEGGVQPRDQVWLNYAPSFVRDFIILREPGCNIAYYNLHERKLKKDEADRWIVNHQLAYYFQFSGFELSKPHQLSRYNQRPELLTKEVFEVLQAFSKEFKVE